MIRFTSDEAKMYDLKEGCVIDISDIVVLIQPMYFDEKKADENITKVLRELKE